MSTHRHVKYSGRTLEFCSQVLWLINDRLTIVALTNATQSLPAKIGLGGGVFSLPDIKLQQPKRTATKLSAEILDGYTGRYRLSGNRVLTIARHDDKLTVSMVMALPNLGPEVAALLQGVSMPVALLTPETTTRFFDQDTHA